MKKTLKEETLILYFFRSTLYVLLVKFIYFKLYVTLHYQRIINIYFPIYVC